eukprot:1393716-Amorphochlora_amoeboformis.AAC.1
MAFRHATLSTRSDVTTRRLIRARVRLMEAGIGNGARKARKYLTRQAQRADFDGPKKPCLSLHTLTTQFLRVDQNGSLAKQVECEHDICRHRSCLSIVPPFKLDQ